MRAWGTEAEHWWSRKTIPALLEEQAGFRGDQVFLYLEEQPITYGDMHQRTVRAASILRELGVTRGDRVAIMMSTCPEWVVTWMASAMLGAVTVPINTANRGDFLSNQLIDSSASVAVVDVSMLGRLAEIRDRLSSLRIVLVRSDMKTPDDGSELSLSNLRVLPIEVLTGEQIIGKDLAATSVTTGGSDNLQAGELAWREAVTVFYTSGTTGPSKGVVTTHQYLLSAAQSMVDCWKLQTGETVYAPLPLFHMSAIGSVLGPLIAGGTGVIEKVFSPSSTWAQVKRYNACGVLLAGAMVVMLWNLPEDPVERDLPIRFISAAPVPAHLYHGIEQRYSCKIVTVYGLSEAFPVTYSGIDDENPPGASGRPNPSLEVAIVDDTDTQVIPGRVGEIVCRPSQPHVIFEGYENRPADTLGRMRNLWFHTGDLGRFDTLGNLTYVDRKKDAMRRRGENISSFEVEQAILRHPGVAEVAAVGVPSDLGEEDVMVWLVPKPGDAIDMVELLDFCAARMPYFAVPRYIEVVEDLPKNAMGRVVKDEIRKKGVRDATWDRERAGYVVRR